MSATAIRRYRLDDLRRFAAALGCAGGLAQPRALALASHLLWFDAAGAASFGIETLPCWLERFESGSVDLTALGKINAERPSMATIDGHNGIAPLVVARAAEVAIEKARDTGVGLVRITQLGALGSAAEIVAAMAVRPVAGLVLGPGRLWSAALPSAAGLPILFDSGLADLETGRIAPVARTGRQGKSAKPSASPLSSPAVDGGGDWRSVLVPGDSWLVAAVALADFEPLSEFHERVGQWIQGVAGGAGPLVPATWADPHAEAHERGVVVSGPVWKELKHWADRFAVTVPASGRS